MKTKSVNEKGLQSEIKELEGEILDLLSDCQRCRMCIRVCPTYEGWYTQSPMGRLMAIHYHLKYGLGSEAELSNLLFACTACRKCKLICKVMSGGAESTDIILKARNLLVKRALARQEEKS